MLIRMGTLLSRNSFFPYWHAFLEIYERGFPLFLHSMEFNVFLLLSLKSVDPSPANYLLLASMEREAMDPCPNQLKKCGSQPKIYKGKKTTKNNVKIRKK